MSREIVLVGIRANCDPPEPVHRFSFNASYRMSLSPFGGRRSEFDPPYHNGSYKRLKEIGLEWDRSLNLLPGCPNSQATFNKEDVSREKLVVDSLSANVRMRRNVLGVEKVDLVLLGSNVCRCFGLTYEPLNSHDLELGTVFILPHPSGLNRWWNDPQNLEDARQFACDIVTDYGREKELQDHGG